MRKVFFLIIITFSFSFSFSSCNREKTEENESINNVVNSDSSINRKTKKDSIELRIDSLFKENNALKLQVEELQNGIDNKIDEDRAYIVVGVVFVIMLLTIVIVYCTLSGKLDHKSRKYKDTFYEINVAFNGLDRRIKKIEEAGSRYAPPVSKGSNSSQVVVTVTAPKEEPIATSKEIPTQTFHREFYMPRTRRNYEFDDARKQFSKDENTFFKFIVDRRNRNKAVFEFDPYDQTNITRSFDDRDNSMVTVCEIEFESNQPTNYVNIVKGEAELRNGKWIVTKKLRLKYV